MDSISFQNGFVCGMATKGLIKSGALYEPSIWNDSGVYNYFYIDFRRTMQAFSLGMFNESIIVFDSQQITVKQVEQCDTTVYKIYCSLANLIHGVTVLNKKTSRLKFSTGEPLPVFSTHMFVAGITSYMDGGYVFDNCAYSNGRFYTSTNESKSITLADAFSISAAFDSTIFAPTFMSSTIKETATVVLT